MTSIFIAICGTSMSLQAVKALVGATQELMSKEFTFKMNCFYCYGLERARNIAVKNFLLTKYDYLFFLDTDIILTKSTIINLIADDKEVIGGVYIHKFPNQPCALSYDGKWKLRKYMDLLRSSKDGLVEVDGTGAGCLLIHKSVFEKVKYPYFKFTDEGGSEDLYFCEKVKKKGIKIFMDIRVNVIHAKLVLMNPRPDVAVISAN